MRDDLLKRVVDSLRRQAQQLQREMNTPFPGNGDCVCTEERLCAYHALTWNNLQEIVEITERIARTIGTDAEQN